MSQSNPGSSLRSRLFVLGLIALFIAAGAFAIWRDRQKPGAQGTPVPIEGGGSQAVEGGLFSVSAQTTPLTIRLSEGQAQPQPSVTPLPVTNGEPLQAEELQQLLSRLPTLVPESGDQTEFHLAQQPIPPPRPGETIQEAFPPPEEPLTPPDVPAGPLQVLRFSPQGEVPVAPVISVTFNQPMVPLGTLEELAAAQVPVIVEPSLPGTWRWIGTRTLNFEYDSELIDRLPKATIFTVTVPAGTRSATGGELAEAVSWSFTTPPPVATLTYPTNEPQPQDPLFFIHFDQRIEPAAVLETIHVTSGGRTVSLKLASAEEVEADTQGKLLLINAVAGRWLAFRAQEPLPADAEVQVQIGPNTPSAEGPQQTQEAQTYSFRTYAPLKVIDHGCSWGGRDCPPLTPFYINFNNPIDPQAFSDTSVRIDPELPGASVNLVGSNLTIQGATRGQTTYTVILSGDIQDIFGQKLGQDVRLTFRVGRAEPALSGPRQALVTLDPYLQKPAVSVFTINYSRLDLKIYAVQPSDWPAYQRYLRDFGRNDIVVTVPGTLVLERSLPVEAATDVLTEVPIDLSEVVDGDFGHFIVIVQPPRGLFSRQQDIDWRTIKTWVQITQIGVDVYFDHSEMVAWTTSLKDGSPLAGVSLEAGPAGTQVTTGEDGLARFSIPSGATYLIARQGADQALLPSADYYWDELGWQTRPVLDELRWYVFDDRQMYRPGEELHLKGWLRRIGGKQDGDVGLVDSQISAVNYRVIDPQGNDLGSGRADVSSLGGFDFSFSIPQATNLGYAQVIFNAEGPAQNLNGREFYHSFQVQEFRRPEFEVKARTESSGPFFAGEQATLAVQAKYYAGDPLPNAQVNWQISSTPGHYAPPNWPDFIFGTWTPWWFERSGPVMEYGPWGPGTPPEIQTFTGSTDASGEHFLQLDFSPGSEHQPVSVLAESTVTDVNRQAWTGSTSLLVHPSRLYVGLRSQRYFVQQGEPLKIELIVTDLDGNPVADRPVEVRAARLEWKYGNGEWREEEVDTQTCSVGSALEPVLCSFENLLGGTYRITALVSDDQGRLNQSQITRWVSGGKLPPSRKIEQEEVTLIPDKETYQPGETAQILVQSPFSPSEGLLTVSRSGLLYTQSFRIEDGSTTLQIPIADEHIPNLQIQVDLNGAAPRTGDQGEAVEGLPPRPAFARGELNLRIPPLSRTLSLELAPEAAELEPGGETLLHASVVDASGQPVSGAELAVVVVDEAILALTNYQLTDPLEIFYTERYSDLSSLYGRKSIILADPLAIRQDAANQAKQNREAAFDSAEMEEMASGAAAPAEAPMAQATMTASAPGQPAGQVQDPIRVRVDFNPLAVFSPAVQTDANGQAVIPVKLPDNLTRYRVMVVAVEGGKQFGISETNLVARLPLMVRPSAPRFLNFGDQFELPVVLQNQTDEPLSVSVAVQATNLELTGSQGLRVTVPARDRVEVRFPAAAQMAGTARLQIAATAGSYADAAVIDLPVYTPATTEAFAVYGVVDEGAVAQPFIPPAGVFPQFGGLEVTTSSTALQALTDAVLYLVSYPFDCAEQLASRILAVASLRDVLTAFQAEGLPAPSEMEAAVQRDLETLKGLQNEDGGWPYWRRGQDSVPFNTLHVAHALVRAQNKGFSVPAEMQSRAMEYLRQIETHYPAWYSQSTRRTLSAYALYVRDLAGDSDPAKALRLIDEAGLENLSLDAIGWLWPVLLDAPGTSAPLEDIRLLVNNRVVETAGAANFTTNYDDQNYLLLGSDRRTDAILLDALIQDNPQSDLIPKLVNGLLAHRTRGRWGSTQENVFVLLSLDRYFNTFESQTPDFVARLWLGDAYAGEHAFSGHTTERSQTDIPMSFLLDPAQSQGGAQDLLLSKEGQGRLYYRLGLRYAPTDLQLDPLEMGFVVSRVYEAVDDPADVIRTEDGTWQIKAGARVRVRLTMVADNRRYHVALVDPLPAGLEIINPDLAVSGGLPPNPDTPEYQKSWWWWSWYEHQNLRDERAEAFTSLLWEGVHSYTYVARATTPGTFIVPPAKAEEMYSPEVFGRSSSDVVVVK